MLNLLMKKLKILTLVYQCEYEVLSINDDMSTNDPFQEQSSTNNTVEEPSAVAKPTILEDAYEASTTSTNLVSDKATKSTTLSAIFFSQVEIMMIWLIILMHLMMLKTS